MMNISKKYLLSILALVIFSFPLYAQEIYLSPVLSFQQGFHSLEKGQNSHPNFSNTTPLSFGGGFGMMLDYKHKSKSIFSTGLILGSFNLGAYQFYGNQGHVMDNLLRIPLLYSYRFHDFKFLRIGKDDKALFVGNLQLQGGLQLGMTQDLLYGSNNNTSLGKSTSDAIEIEMTNAQILNDLNLSLRLGVGFQFQHQGKDRLKLAVYYTQGLGILSETTVEYSVKDDNGNISEYSDVFKSNGSMLAIELSYPIRIWKRN